MKIKQFVCATTCVVFMGAAHAAGDEVTIVSNVLGPEGPLYGGSR
jgi:hypothetical protein